MLFQNIYHTFLLLSSLNTGGKIAIKIYSSTFKSKIKLKYNNLILADDALYLAQLSLRIVLVPDRLNALLF